MIPKNKHVFSLDSSKIATINWLSHEEVLKRIPLSRTNIWMQIERGEFPRPMKWKNQIFWNKADIERWINDRLTASRDKKPLAGNG